LLTAKKEMSRLNGLDTVKWKQRMKIGILIQWKQIKIKDNLHYFSSPPPPHGFEEVLIFVNIDELARAVLNNLEGVL